MKSPGAMKSPGTGTRRGSRRPRPAVSPPAALRWVGGVEGHLSLVDQTLLPGRFVRARVGSVKDLWRALRRLVVRGAPAIGVAAAYGVVLGARASRAGNARDLEADVLEAVDHLATSRPTAVNLFWALDRMKARLKDLLSARPFSREAVLRGLLEEARAVHQEDRELCEAIGRHGAKLLRSGNTVLTHCNAGALATGGAGTALSVLYQAAAAGKKISVFADETRPLWQGARLTSWELEQAGIDVTLICDSMAGSVLASGKVDCVIVGADRIAASGDVANKIGTYGVAVLAREHGVPFYVAAPSTTFDLNLRSGKEIPIEERSADEVAMPFGRRVAPRGVNVYNPAFDVTPARYVTGIITERGVIRPPYSRSIRKLLIGASSGVSSHSRSSTR